MSLTEAALAIFSRVGAQRKRRDGIDPEHVVAALYRGMLGREPDPPGLAAAIEFLRSGDALEELTRGFVASPEFRQRFLDKLMPGTPLPDLTALMPEKYDTQQVYSSPATIYVAREDADMARMEELIEVHRYYDRFGVWAAVIDLDKEITAAIVQGLGARSCFELGCFTGPVLTLLVRAGIDVLGAEVSHTAFTFSYPDIRDAMRFGDLLSLDIERRFDVVLCMDVLEHVSPLRVGAYIEALAARVEDDGYIYLNAPMWGPDRIYGVVEEQYLDEWRRVGDAANWRHWPCDERGWPIHGHLVWASPGWWERTFAEHGLVRDVVIEQAVHAQLGRFFATACGRRSLFVLRRPGNSRSSSAVAAEVATALAGVPGVPQPSTV